MTMGWRGSLWLGALAPFAAQAQDANADPAPSAARADAVLVAGVSGGLVSRTPGDDSPFATASLTRYKGKAYLRLAATAYRGTLRQIDAALPSTYYVASLGAGGNWDGWTLDGYVSYGRQRFGQVETALGKRDSGAGTGSAYFAAGLRGGHVFRAGSRWYISPTAALQALRTRSLRHRIDAAGPVDFQLPESAVTASAALRVDYAFGKTAQHTIGVSAERFVSSNGLTAWRLASNGSSSGVVPLRTPDGWTELGASASFQMRPGLWFDGELRRSFGAIAGDSTTAMIGIRVRI